MDTSVVFAAVLSSTGGGRKLFQLGEVGMLNLFIGPNVLRECEAVVRRKASSSLPTLAHLLSVSRVVISPAPNDQHISAARALVRYEPDAYVLAEAFCAEPDWFVTHDQEHFLKKVHTSALPFQLGTPGDLLRSLKDKYTPI
jgi:predicted nucleic acid-binding protein